MSRLRNYFRRWSEKPKVRPWALLAPVLLIFVALPLLRPLRFPASPAADESVRLETIQSIVERRSFAIKRSEKDHREAWLEGTVTLHRPIAGVFSGQPPFMSSLLAGAYFVMNRAGLSMDENPTLVTYLLTLLGSTLPAACAAGLIYRMARMFELQRSLRTLLSVAVAFGSGLGSYSTVLNPHVPAAALLLSAVAAIIHWARAENPFKSLGWLSIAGLCAAGATVMDPLTLVFLILLFAPIFTLRVGFPTRLAGALLYFAGAAFPLVAHGSICSRLGIPVIPQPFIDAPEQIAASDLPDDEDASPTKLALLRVVNVSVGAHGAFVHFPILLFACFGIAAVMHRNWPLWMKTLASVTGVGAGSIFLYVSFSHANLQYAMFANRWFLSFSPLMILWCGAWLKRPHSKGIRACAIGFLVFSIIVGIIGMIHPWPNGGYGGYTMVDVLSRISE